MAAGASGADEAGDVLPRRQVPAWVFAACGAAVVAIGLTVGLILRDRAKTAEIERKIEALLAAAKERGEPASLADLPGFTVPDEENVAPLVLAAADACDAAEAAIKADPAMDAGKWDAWLGLDDSAELAAPMAAKGLARHGETLSLVEKALERDERPRAQYVTDYSAGFNMLLPHLSRIRELARLLRRDAEAKAAAGDVAGAARAVDLTVRLGDTLADEPLLISALVRAAVLGIAFAAVDEMSRQGSLTDDLRRALLPPVSRVRARGMMARPLMGERCSGDDVFQGIISGRLKAGNLMMPRALGYVPRRFFLRDRLFYIEQMERYVRVAALPWPEAKGEAEKIGASSEGIAKGLHLDRIMSGQILPALAWSMGTGARVEALRDVTRVGLAVELFRGAKGRLPTDLAELAPEFIPEVPMDPCTGKPLVYKMRDGGFVVYSLGTDMTDDGGAPAARGGRSEPGDIVWPPAPADSPPGGASLPFGHSLPPSVA